MHRNTSGIAYFITAAAGLCGPAFGACSWSIGSYTNGFIPDFDQKRAPGPLVFDGMNFMPEPPGLPGNGGAYCSPTAHTNTMAYLANHGFPGLMPGGAAAWQSAGKYKTVTEAIREMGVYMQTDPVDGTLCCGESGLEHYLDLHAPGKFTVTSSSSNKMYSPTMGTYVLCAQLGGFVHAMIGWFQNTGPNQWIKAGGHVTTMTGVAGWCGMGARTMSIRDPGSGNTSLIAQSTFSTATLPLTAINGFFNSGEDNGGITVYYQRTQERMVGYDTSTGKAGFLNGLRVVWPRVGVTISPLQQPSFDLHIPILPTHHPIPPYQNLPIATSTPIIDFAIDPQQTSILYTVKDPAGDPDPRVFQLDRETGASQVVYTGLEARAVETGRFRQFFIIDRSRLVMIDNEIVPPAVTIRSTPAQFDAMAYDDATDTLVCLSASARTLVRYDGRDFTAAPQTKTLPPSVILSGDVYLTISPLDGGVWVRSHNEFSIKKLLDAASGGLVVAETANIPEALNAIGIDVDVRQTKEHILLARQTGVVGEYEKDSTTGAWVASPDSIFAGLAAAGPMRLSRSRNNHDAATMNGPQYVDELPGTFGASALDCPGDLNGDGAVNSADLALLLGAWGPAGEDPADLNSDGSVNSADLALLLGSWGACR